MHHETKEQCPPTTAGSTANVSRAGLSPAPTDGSEWVSVSTRSGSWQVRHSFAQPSFLARLENPSQLQAPPAQPLRTDTRTRRTFLVRAIFPEHPETSVVIKRYHHRGLSRSLKDLLRPSGARRALQIARYLEEQQIPTARPIAAGQLRWYGLPGESYFLTDEVTPSVSLRQIRRSDPPPIAGKIVLGALGELMARLHNASLSHTDPTLSNFLARTNPFALILIDVDGLRLLPSITPSVVAEDFRRLFHRIPVSTRERHWFLVRYCRQRRGGPTARELQSRL